MSERDREFPRLIPTGTCWCGCGAETSRGAFFVAGHDKIAEAALLGIRFGGQVHQLLQHFGFGPHRPVIYEAVDQQVWERCPRIVDGRRCWYAGTPASVLRHIERAHPGGKPLPANRAKGR